eukprot:Filipodium_phascolosomae@DN478_c0_g1_i1.p1
MGDTKTSLRERRLQDEVEALRSQVEAWECLIQHQHMKIAHLEKKEKSKKGEAFADDCDDAVLTERRERREHERRMLEMASLHADQTTLNRRLDEVLDRNRVLEGALFRYQPLASQIEALKRKYPQTDDSASVTVVCGVWGAGAAAAYVPQSTKVIQSIPAGSKLMLDLPCEELVQLRSRCHDLEVANTTVEQQLLAVLKCVYTGAPCDSSSDVPSPPLLEESELDERGNLVNSLELATTESSCEGRRLVVSLDKMSDSGGGSATRRHLRVASETGYCSGDKFTPATLLTLAQEHTTNQNNATNHDTNHGGGCKNCTAAIEEIFSRFNQHTTPA